METRLKRLLALSLLGIFVLLFLSKTLEPPISTISSLNTSDIGTSIKLVGTISAIREYENSAFHIFTITDSTGKIKAITNAQDSLKTIIKNGTNYEVTGKIEEYNKTLEINVNKIKNVD